MEVQEAHELRAVLLGLVPHPARELARFDGLEGCIARKRLGTGVVAGGIAVPFESVASIEVDPFAESDARFLAILAPQSIGFPRVNVPIGVERGNENPVKLLEEFGDAWGFPVFGYQGICHIGHRAGADPFPRVGSSGDDDGFPRRRWPFRVGRMHTYSEGVDVSPFVRDADADHADMRREQ